VILAALAIGVCVGGYLVGGDRRYLRWAWRLLQGTLVLALIFFGVLLVERL
jgi:hypothetical protein